MLDIQTRIGNQLTSLEIRWTELISSVLQIEMANVALYAEVERLDKKEAELASL
jgi:Breast carcinoma amplified sequence 2 (BCAS2)